MTNSIVSANSSIEVSDHQGQLVVDSRLIANRLGVQHKATMQLIRNNIEDLKEFGHLPFEMAKPTEGSTGGRPETFCYLNEDQSTYLMTLSKNTEQVKLCKKHLVQAFSKAKQIIKTVIPAQSDRIQELQMELEIERMRNQREARQDARIALHGLSTTLLLEGKSDSVVEVDRPILEVIDTQSGVKFSGQTTKQLADYLNKNGGRSFKSGAELERELNKLGRSDLIDTVPRKTLQPFISKDNLQEACRILVNNRQQQLL
jgi:phage regulator Rha-like protein